MTKKSGVKKGGWSVVRAAVLSLAVLAVMLLISLVGIVDVRQYAKATIPVAETPRHQTVLDSTTIHTAVLSKNLSGRETLL